MPLIVTSLELSKLCPTTAMSVLTNYADPINQTIAKYSINTKLRLSAFLAQIAFESEYFTKVEEDLNYTAAELLKVFPKYFPNETIANEYAHQPIKIANFIYSLRMGNGNEASGDGYNYRGKGLIQLTGKYEYTQLGKEFNIPLSNVGAYLITPIGATMSAGYFWNINHLNTYADVNKFALITKKINGGSNGALQRAQLYTNAQKFF